MRPTVRGADSVDPVDRVAARIEGHCEFFGRMFELIPAKFYFSSEQSAQASYAGSKYSHNKKRTAPKQAVKEASAKAKKARLNPDAQKTNRERLIQGALDYTDTKESTGMDELKQRLQMRMEELRRQRQATAHRKVNMRTDEVGKQTRKKARSSGKALSGAGSRPAHAQVQNSSLANTEGPLLGDAKASAAAVADLQFAAEPAKSDGGHPRRNSKKTDGQLLKQAVAFERRLENTDAEQRKSMLEGASWGAMMQRAQGTKVKNDAALLRKSIKRKEKMKEKSKRGWDKRIKENAQNAKDRTERTEAKKKWV